MLGGLMPAVAWFDAHQGAVVAAFTIVLTIAVVLLWAATLGLQRMARKQSEDLRRVIATADASVTAAAMTAQAARQTFQTLEDIGERQLRAYVSVSEAYISSATGKTPPTISLEVRNFGQTPAYDLIWLASYTVSPEPDAAPFALHREVPPSKSTLFPATTTSKTIILPGWKPDYGEMISAGKAAVYAFGEISYTDAFGKKRRVAYRLKHGGSQGVRPEKLYPTEEGNEAN